MNADFHLSWRAAARDVFSIRLRRRWFIVWLTGLVFSLVAVAPPAMAQEPSPTPAATETVPPTVTPTPTATPNPIPTAIPLEQSPPGVAELTFAQLGQPTFELRSPAASLEFTFALPYRWRINDSAGAFLDLHFDLYADFLQGAFLSGDTGATTAPTPVVDIYLNDTLAISFAPDQGLNQSLRIPLPAAWPRPPGAPIRLRLAHFTGRECTGLTHTRLVVKEDSFLHLAYVPEPLPTVLDLTEWPRLFYQGLYTPETALLVIPDSYTAADLTAAATVAAAVGGQTAGRLSLQLVTAEAATNTLLQTHDAIIVGRPDQNSLLAALYQNGRLPTTYSGTLLDPAGQPIAEDSGLLQLIVSEQNPNHLLLVVTGASDQAVQTAARALAGPSRPAAGPLAMIPAGNQLETQLPETISLADAGFQDTTFYGLGTHRSTISLFLPALWPRPESVPLQLVFLHSAALAADASDMTVEVNGRPVSSLPLTGGDNREQVVELAIPAADLRLGGLNSLTLAVTMAVQETCVMPDTGAVWARIRATSGLSVGEASRTAGGNGGERPTLTTTLVNLAAQPNLGDVWFWLSDQPGPAELTSLIQLAGRLGFSSGGGYLAWRVSQGKLAEEGELFGTNVIAMGQSAVDPTAALVGRLAAAAGTRLDLGQSDVTGLGVLWVTAAPWNPDQTLVVVTGTTDEGVGWAAETLLAAGGSAGLTGDLALIRATRVETYDTTTWATSSGEEIDDGPAAGDSSALVGTEGPPANPVTPATSPSETTDLSPGRPAMPTLMVILLVGGGVAVAVGGFVISRRKEGLTIDREGP
ncbi:MAG: cellulose biosynthesis cyclic di-GMP-binding regulatory protein BcsB [Chloroflexota bacterium]